MTMGNKILNYKEAILRDLERLVAVPSVCGPAKEGLPFGEDSARALGLILRMAEEMGFKVRNVGNYAGHAEYGEGGETAAVLTHVDVVPAGGGWKTEPFCLTRKDNLYFGRGAADDKGAAIVALYCLKALKDEKITGKRRIRVIFGAGEEIGSNDMDRYFASEPMPAMAFTPDSDYGICNREKGILRLDIDSTKSSGTVRSFSAGSVVNAVPELAEATLDCGEDRAAALRTAADSCRTGGKFKIEKAQGGVKVTSFGKASHAMHPQDGINAAAQLIRLLSNVFPPEKLGGFFSFLDRYVGLETDGAALGVAQSDGPSGGLTLNLGLVRADPEKASAGFDIRYPVTKKGGDVFAVIRKKAEKAGLKAELRNDMGPLYIPESNPLIPMLRDSYKAVMGVPAELYATGGGTYARSIPGRAVAFGPFFPDEPDRRLHNSNESIDIGYFMKHAQICLEAMYRMMTE